MQSSQTLEELKKISLEEDYLINQLDSLEGMLDGYLNYTANHSLESIESESKIYFVQSELETLITNLKLTIFDLEKRANQTFIDDHEIRMHLDSITFDNQNSTLTSLLSNFYTSIQNLKLLQSKVQHDVHHIKLRLGLEASA